MKRLLAEASLIMKPEGQADGLLPSVKPIDGSGDFTFSRGSNLAATRVNQAGLIEKGRENLLLQSNQFDTTWTYSGANVSVTSGQSGYDNSTDAWLLGLDYTGGDAYLRQNKSISGVNTFSIYAKSGSVDGIYIEFAAGGFPNIKVDLSNGSLISTTGTIDTKIESVGSGWYRVSLSVNQSLARVNIRSVNGSGTATSGTIYIQDAQLESGLAATPYIPTTTTTAKAGILEDTPRLDYSGGATEPSLLLEPQRTNKALYSEGYVGYQTSTSGTGVTPVVSQNAAVSPDGTQNAFRVDLDRGTGNTSGDYSWIYQSGVVYSGENQVSVYLKAATTDDVGKEVDLRASGGSQTFTLTADWVRYTMSKTSSSTSDVGLYSRGGANADNAVSCYVYGLQVENNASYPTSYIPTYGSAVTRSFDECIDAGDNSVIDSTQGTIYGEQKSLESNFTYNYFAAVSDGTNNNRLEIRQSGTGIQFLWRVGGTYQNSVILSSAPFSSTIKYALRYSSADIKFYVNGSLVGTINSPTLYPSGTLNNFQFADGSGGTNFRGVVNQALYFPTALTDSECIALTSL